MTFESLLILGSIWTSILWGLGLTVLFFTALILVAVILMQDSKEGGLGGAFGGAGGDSFLGAKAQKGITRFTAGLGIFFGCLLLLLGKIDPAGTTEVRALPGDEPEKALEAPAPESADAGASTDAGVDGSETGEAPSTVGTAPEADATEEEATKSATEEDRIAEILQGAGDSSAESEPPPTEDDSAEGGSALSPEGSAPEASEPSKDEK